MVKIFKGIVIFNCMLHTVMMAAAQVKIEVAPKAPGKIIRHHNTLQFLNSFKVLTPAKALSLAHTADRMMDIICQSPPLNPPVGYNAKVNVAASDLGLKEQEPHLKVLCLLRYLTKDSRYKGIKESMDGADLILNINSFDFFDQMGNYWKACDNAKFPLFFEKPVITDSTNSYLEISRDGTPVRFICSNDKPLLIPLTRKEFIQFLIARKKYQISDDQKTIADLEKTMKEARETLAHPASYLTESVKKALADGIIVQEKQVEDFREGIKKKQVKCRQYLDFLNAMPAAEAAAPVRLDYHKKSDDLIGGIGQMVPIGRHEGAMLTKVNPDYYNNSPAAPAAQLITVYYSWPTIGFTQAPDYLKRATMDIFNHLDYHALKESMQQ